MSSQVDNFITRLSLVGVDEMKRGQQAVGAGWAALSGQVGAADAAYKKLGVTQTQVMLVGGIAAAAGGAMLSWLRSCGVIAADAGRVQAQFGAALRQNIGVTGRAAETLSEYAESLSAAEGRSMFSDEQIKSAMGMLSTFRIGSADLRRFTPALLDLAEGYRKASGETVDLQRMALMLGKATQGNTTALQRYGIKLDETRVKQVGLNAAILETIQKRFGGQSAAVMETAAGKLAQYEDAVEELKESLGTGLLPAMASLASKASGAANWLNKANKAMGGAVGIALGLAAGLMLVGGSVTLMLPALNLLAAAWRAVGAAASGAAVEQGAAAAATATAGATATAAAGRIGMSGFGRFAAPFAAVLAGGYLRNNYAPGAAAAGAKSATPGGRRNLNQLGAFAASVGGNALEFGALGAAAGSVIPGIGTGIGLAVGGIAGAIKGAIEGNALVKSSETADFAARGKAGSKNPQLEEIASILRDTHRALVGGGSRANAAVNAGDVERAILGRLGAVVG